MFRGASSSVASRCVQAQQRAHRYPLSRPLGGMRYFSRSPASLQTLPVEIHGQGSGTTQTISIPGKSYTISTDTYPVLGGKDSAPSPVSYSLASLGSCTQVTGNVVAKDHGIKLGKWDVKVVGQLPTAVLVKGEQGNPNWESVVLKVRVETDVRGGSDDPKFQHFVAEAERRCPITALFKRSGVAFTSEWVNEGNL